MLSIKNIIALALCLSALASSYAVSAQDPVAIQETAVRRLRGEGYGGGGGAKTSGGGSPSGGYGGGGGKSVGGGGGGKTHGDMSSGGGTSYSYSFGDIPATPVTETGGYSGADSLGKPSITAAPATSAKGNAPKTPNAPPAAPVSALVVNTNDPPAPKNNAVQKGDSY